jgi:hypothetical protein
MAIIPGSRTTYTITATNQAGIVDDQAVIIVSSQPQPQEEGSFGEQYQDLIPADAAMEHYAENRFAVITGTVENLSGQPLGGVQVAIHDHPEYGTTSTDGTGRFNLPVQGGGTLTVSYSKAGLIPSQRQVDVLWNDIAVVETIQMLPQDPAATTLTLDGDPATVLTHESSEVVDDFGSRSATLVLTGDNRAYAVDEEGNDLAELTTITVRATEFVTEESMPGRIAPCIGLHLLCGTYCRWSTAGAL